MLSSVVQKSERWRLHEKKKKKKMRAHGTYRTGDGRS